MRFRHFGSRVYGGFSAPGPFNSRLPSFPESAPSTLSDMAVTQEDRKRMAFAALTPAWLRAGLVAALLLARSSAGRAMLQGGCSTLKGGCVIKKLAIDGDP